MFRLFLHRVAVYPRKLYFRVLFGVVRSHGFAIVAADKMADAHTAALDNDVFCSRSGYLRDGNANAHKAGKRAERKISANVAKMADALRVGMLEAFLKEGRRYDW